MRFLERENKSYGINTYSCKDSLKLVKRQLIEKCLFDLHKIIQVSGFL